MTEIRIDVDLPHPPRRVWQAVTDPDSLADWFMAVEFSGGGFTLRPAGVAGLDAPILGEIVESISGEQLVLRWRTEQLHTLVTVTLRASEVGCRLTVLQRGFFGQQGTLRRRALQQAYTAMIRTGLPAVLERLEAADRERDDRYRNRADAAAPASRWSVRRNQASSFAVMPRQASMAWAGLKAAGRNMSLRSSSAPGLASWRRRPPARGVAAPAGEALSESPTTALTQGLLIRLAGGSRGAGGHRRRVAWLAGTAVPRTPAGRRAAAAAASLAMVGLLGLLAVQLERLTEPGDPSAAARPAAGTQPTDRASGAGGGGTPTADPAPGVGVSPVVPGGGQPSVILAATYRTDRTVVGGYEGMITVNNLSAKAVNGWSVRIELPPLGLVVRQVDGALAAQDDRTVSFTPVQATRVVPAGDSVRFTFQVQGVGAPLGCSIDGRPCGGVPG